MLRAGVVLVVAALLGNGCSRVDTGRRAGVGIVVASAASHYTTDTKRANTSGDVNEQRLRGDVAEALARRGDRADADTTLDAVATWALNEKVEGRTVDATQLRAAKRMTGEPD